MNEVAAEVFTVKYWVLTVIVGMFLSIIANLLTDKIKDLINSPKKTQILGEQSSAFFVDFPLSEEVSLLIALIVGVVLIALYILFFVDVSSYNGFWEYVKNGNIGSAMYQLMSPKNIFAFFFVTGFMESVYLRMQAVHRRNILADLMVSLIVITPIAGLVAAVLMLLPM